MPWISRTLLKKLSNNLWKATSRNSQIHWQRYLFVKSLGRGLGWTRHLNLSLRFSCPTFPLVTDSIYLANETLTLSTLTIQGVPSTLEWKMITVASE